MADIFATDAWIALLELIVPVGIIGTVGTIVEHREDRRKETRE